MTGLEVLNVLHVRNVVHAIGSFDELLSNLTLVSSVRNFKVSSDSVELGVVSGGASDVVVFGLSDRASELENYD